MTALERIYDRRQLFWIGLPILMLAFASRDLNALIWPAAFFEDGRHLIEPYYNETDISSTWRFYRNYVVLASNLVAYLVSYLPITQVPLGLTVSELFFIALPVGLLLRPEIRIPLVELRDRLLLAAILAAAPIANSYLLNTLMYGLWPLLAALSLIVLFVEIKSWRSFCGYAALCLLCIFSNPVAVALVPAILFRAFRERGSLTGFLMLLLLLLLAIYLLAGVELGGGVGGDLSFDLLFLGLRTLLERVFFEGLLGGRLRTALLRSDLAWTVSLFGGALFACCLLLHGSLWRSNREAALDLLPVWAIAFGILVCCIYIRGDSLDKPWNHRYSYVPCFLVLVTGYLLVKNALRPVLQRRIVVQWLLLGLVAWAAAVVQLQTQFYKRPIAEGVVLAGFLEAVAEKEEAAAPFCLLLNRGPKDIWRLTLKSRWWEGDCEVFERERS